MTLDEAIERNEKLIASGILHLEPEAQTSVGLGIEALIAWRQYRRKKAPASLYLLPGETKD